MKTGVIVQARTSSTRLPGKVLKELPMGSGITVLEQVIRRLKQSQKLDEIVVATTTEDADDPIVEIAKKEGVKYFRGSRENVLQRYYLAALENNLDWVVRVTSDCPCIDANILDLVVETHLKSGSNYTSNTLLRTFPDGLDVEVFNFKALESAYYNAKSDLEKEHVTTYIHTTASKNFELTNFKANVDASKIRITLDNEEDYALLCTIFDYLYPNNEFFNFNDIMNLFNEKPWLKIINKKMVEKEVFITLEDEMKKAIELLELHELKRAENILKEYSENKFG